MTYILIRFEFAYNGFNSRVVPIFMLWRPFFLNSTIYIYDFTIYIYIMYNVYISLKRICCCKNHWLLAIQRPKLPSVVHYVVTRTS